MLAAHVSAPGKVATFRSLGLAAGFSQPNTNRIYGQFAGRIRRALKLRKPDVEILAIATAPAPPIDAAEEFSFRMRPAFARALVRLGVIRGVRPLKRRTARLSVGSDPRKSSSTGLFAEAKRLAGSATVRRVANASHASVRPVRCAGSILGRSTGGWERGLWKCIMQNYGRRARAVIRSILWWTWFRFAPTAIGCCIGVNLRLGFENSDELSAMLSNIGLQPTAAGAILSRRG
jgi:hypothetical protein